MGYLHFQRSPLLLYDFFYFYILPISTDLFTERNSRILPSEISGLPNGNLPTECRQIFLDILFPFIVPEDDIFSTSDAKYRFRFQPRNLRYFSGCQHRLHQSNHLSASFFTSLPNPLLFRLLKQFFKPHIPSLPFSVLLQNADLLVNFAHRPV